MADKGTLAVRFVAVKPADFAVSGSSAPMSTITRMNRSDVVVENGKAVSGVVVSVGGFLVMGESYVVLDPTTVVLSKTENTWKAFVDTSKDNLKGAPKFTYERKK